MKAAEYREGSEAVACWAEGRVAELMGTVNAATAELVSVIGRVLESGAWGGAGVRSPEHWVAWRAGVSAGRARALVAMARRLGELPEAAAQFSAGRLSEDSVRLVVARTPAARDAEVANLATHTSVAQLGRILRSLPPVPSDPDEPPKAEADTDSARVCFGYDDDRWSLRAVGLAPDDGALVTRALEAAREAEFRQREPQAPPGDRPRGVSWARALVRMAAAALDSLDPATAAGGRPSDRYQVLVHVRPGDTPAANVHLGPALSDAARRRLTCDANLRWVLEEDGRPLALGRRRRTIDPTLRRLIEERDRGCRIPACEQRVGIEIHHIVHFEDGGETVAENLAGLCGHHHHEHHMGRLGISGDPTAPDGLIFTDRWGRRIEPPSPVPPPDRPEQPRDRPPPRYVASSGEPLDSRWFAWAEVVGGKGAGNQIVTIRSRPGGLPATLAPYGPDL